MGRIRNYDLLEAFNGDETFVVETDEGTKSLSVGAIKAHITTAIEEKADMLNQNDVTVVNNTKDEYILSISVGAKNIITPNLRTVLDSELSDTSENAVENKVVNKALKSKQNQLMTEITLPYECRITTKALYDEFRNSLPEGNVYICKDFDEDEFNSDDHACYLWLNNDSNIIELRTGSILNVQENSLFAMSVNGVWYCEYDTDGKPIVFNQLMTDRLFNGTNPDLLSLNNALTVQKTDDVCELKKKNSKSNSAVYCVDETKKYKFWNTMYDLNRGDLLIRLSNESNLSTYYLVSASHGMLVKKLSITYNAVEETVISNINIPLIQVNYDSELLNPNTYYQFGEKESLSIRLANGISDTINEYMFEFISGENPTTLTIPASISWVSETVISANKKYQVSILNGVGIMVGVDI